MKKYIMSTIIMLSLGLAQEAKFSALGFYDLTYSKDSDISNVFEFQRVYFTFEKRMSDALSYKFQTDVGRVDDDGKLEVIFKKCKG